MNNNDQGLLPVGLSDVLAPDAAFEAYILESLLKDFSAHGYDRVAPPLIEFEDSLLTGIGSGLAEQTFRLMDPESQKMMGVRADMTPQVARIAARRLSKEPRPLRLSYAGQVLRVRGSQLRPERQFTQVGAELIGPEKAIADSEVIILAAASLEKIGISELSIDLGLPRLVTAVLRNTGENLKSRARLRQALDRKDSVAISELSEEFSQEAIQTLTSMLNAAGPANSAIEALAGLSFTGEAENARNLLTEVIERVSTALPNLNLTIDPVENRGFEYHTGVTFTFFAKNVRGELGSGGRYMVNSESGNIKPEAATGFTLFMDTVIRALPSPPKKRRIYIPTETPIDVANSLRTKGWITVAALSSEEEIITEADRLGCAHILQNNNVKKISKIKSN
jgi:ATP phosphoribosyltransferase regulatory subunit